MTGKTKVLILAVACPLDGSDVDTAYLAVTVITTPDLCRIYLAISAINLAWPSSSFRPGNDTL